MNKKINPENDSYVVKTENRAKVVATFFAWWKKSLEKEFAYQYWRDIHGPWAARTPGFYQYRQLHLEHVDASLLSNLKDIELDVPKVDQPNGIANIFYSSRIMANLLRMPFAKKIADKDNTYYVGRNTYQRAQLPISRTYIDKIDRPEYNGKPDNPRYILAFKKNKDIEVDDFGNYLVNEFCTIWSQNQQIQRLRLEVLNRHTDEPTSPNGVRHNWKEDKQYNAWIEVELSNEVPVSSLFDSDKSYKNKITGLHVYPIKEIYTFVFKGKPTLVGLRGYQAATLIDTMNSDFQKSRKILKSLYKKDIYRR
ncbi:MAG: hypothetical protein AAGA77_10420 [Bacteroidota bacterium]